MDMAKLVAIAILAAMMIIALKSVRPEISLALSLASGAVLLFIALSWAVETLGSLQTLSQRYALDPVFLSAALKIVGVAYMGEFGAQLCRDAGQGSLASKVELGGKILILTMTLPMVEEILLTVAGFLS